MCGNFILSRPEAILQKRKNGKGTRIAFIARSATKKKCVKKMTKDRLKKNIDELIPILKEHWNEHTFGSLTLFVFGEDGNRQDIPIPKSMLDKRREILAGFGRALKNAPFGIEAIIVAGLAWIGSPQNKKDDNLIMPSQDPKKREGIFIFGSTSSGEELARVFIISETDRNKLTEMPEMEKAESTSPSPLLSAFWGAYLMP